MAKPKLESFLRVSMCRLKSAAVALEEQSRKHL